jgi:phage terminase large subunit-like protein
MFDEQKADRVVQFFETYLRHCSGQWAGQTFHLIGWQKELLRTVYGTLREDGSRQYRKVFVFIPKKNGKSELAAGVALFALLADREPGAEVYSAAGDREQASIVFNTAKNMILQDRSLRKMCKIKDSTKRIIVPKTFSSYKVLSKESFTKHGLNISCAVIDELHVVTRELFEVLTQGSGAARRQPLIFMITTAGDDKNSICHEQYTYAKQVRDGIIDDPEFLPVIFEKPEGAEWDDESAWIAANPSIGVTITLDGFRQAVREAKNIPSTINSFRQLRLNEWISSRSKWLDVAKWDAAVSGVPLSEFAGETCYCALDLSSTTDITAFAAIFYREERYYLFLKLFCPAEKIRQRSTRDKVPYIQWAKEGWITATEGDVIDYKAVESYIFEFAKAHAIAQVNIDRWNATQIIQNLTDAGVTTVGFGQGFVSMTTPSKEFEVAVLKGTILHEGNPVMRWMVDNVIVRKDPAENIKPDKERSSERIDGVVASIMALDGWVRKLNKPSAYERERLTFI